jgi:hypothetical protein
MPTFIEVRCPCGRTLRARSHQAGAAIQCWDCKAEVIVPEPPRSGLARPLSDAAAEALQPPAVLVIVGFAALATAILIIPRVGVLLALGLVAASAQGYGRQVGAAVPAASPGGAGASPRWALPVRCALAVAAAFAVAAPLFLRNRGHALPPPGTAPTLAGIAAAAVALACAVVVPVALCSAYACDHQGPLPSRLVLRALARHPAATLLALLLLPLALILTEGFVALISWQQGQLPLLVVDLFPPPVDAYRVNGRHLEFDYDGTRLDRNYSESLDSVAGAYPYGLRHGFTLVGTVPASLSVGLLQVRTNPWEYAVTPVAYLILRVSLTLVILAAGSTALVVQARWLGVIAALGSHRPVRSTS